MSRALTLKGDVQSKFFAATMKLEGMRLNALRVLRDKKVARMVSITACAFFGFFGIFLFAATAHAITAPTQGSFAYTVYDVAVNQILKGPIGFVGGVGAMVLGAILAIQQKIMPGVLVILAGVIMLNADTLVTSLGLTF